MVHWICLPNTWIGSVAKGVGIVEKNDGDSVLQ